MSRVVRLSAIRLTILCVLSAFAAIDSGLTATSAPDSTIRISVMTIGSGAEVWERFGHNSIVVEDPTRGTTLAYNYGMFSFRQENFLFRFLQGRMHYWMAGFDADQDMRRYMNARRSIWVQQLALTPEQATAMRDFLEWNAKPENAYYRYDYYRDNCSTRVRDAIDRVLGGTIKSQMTHVPAGTTYRFHTQRLTSNNIPIYTGLLLLLGRSVDQPLSAWEEMFLPLSLHDHLREVRIRQPDGSLRPLVASERVVYRSEAFPVPAAPPRWGWAYFAVGLLVAAVLLGLARLSATQPWARTGFGWTAGILLSVSGVAGTIMIGVWAFTDHVVAAANENVLQMNLLALGLFALLIPFLRGRAWAQRPAVMLALGIGLCSLLGALIKLLPGGGQENGQVLALLVPINLGLAASVWRLRDRVGRETTRV